ncbi:MAG: hypothetical protein MI810_04420 [Flavobacteriales bacterium]|nr:hypothetical protein [Flavobacteriales bacterium]
MKHLFSFIFLAFIIGSCCKIDIAVGLRLEYPNMTNPADITVLRTEKSNGDIADTLLMDQLYPTGDGSYVYFVDFYEPEVYNYIIQVDSMSYSDTITDYSYEIKGFNCNKKVRVDYKHNGITKTENSLEIN